MPICQSFKEDKIIIKGLETNYKTAGTGEIILILHGWGGSSDSWIKVMEVLSDKNCQVIVPDLPGFGKSQQPTVPWKRDDYLIWLLNFLESQKLTSFILISHSFGGSISIKLAAKYPEKIKKLILCSPAGIKQKPDPKAKIIYAAAKIGDFLLSSKHLSKIRNHAKDGLYFLLRRKDYVKAKGPMRQTFINVLNEDLTDEISKIKTDTLIVWGSKDEAISLKNAFVFKENIAGSKLEILKNVGHSPQLEVPEELSAIIYKFISKQK